MSFPDHSGRYWLPNSEPFDNPHEWLALVFGAIDDSLGREGNWLPDDFAEYTQRDGDLKYLLEQAMQCFFPLESDIVKFFVVSHRENQNTNGGTTSNDTYNVHPLNTEIADADNLVSVGSGDMTVEPGTWLFIGIATCYRPNSNRAAFYNVTASQRVAQGMVSYNDNALAVSAHPMVLYSAVLAVPTTFRLEVWTQTGAGGNGLGVPSNKTTEDYAFVIGLKVA